MKFEWDEVKRRLNLEKHGVDFMDVAAFWESHQVVDEDLRDDYAERRWISYGLLRRRVMALAYTIRNDCVRVISFRKANIREVVKYDQAIQRCRT